MTAMRSARHPRWPVARQTRGYGVPRLRPDYDNRPLELFGAAVVVLGGIALWVARRRRVARDERLTASSGGWRIRSRLDLDAGDPYSRFPGLKLAAPHDVIEGREDGFEVSYFRGSPRRRMRRPPYSVFPYALVQVPEDPPRMRYVATGIPGAVPPGWGPQATKLFDGLQGMVVETAPYALLVRGNGASAEAVGRFALALAKAVVADADPDGHRPARPTPVRPGFLSGA